MTREDLQCAYKTFGLDVGIEECDEIVLHMDTTGEGMSMYLLMKIKKINDILNHS